jgi:hypothetical protein
MHVSMLYLEKVLAICAVWLHPILHLIRGIRLLVSNNSGGTFGFLDLEISELPQIRTAAKHKAVFIAVQG